MSGARFQQELINVRARLNELENHRHDALYEPKGLFLGKNLLINADKRESQRGVFTSATSIVNTQYYIDRYYANISVITGTLEHGVFDSEFEANTIKFVATSSATGSLSHLQKVEHFDRYAGKTVTYAVKVKSNYPVRAQIYDGVEIHYSSAHSGNGEIETLIVTTIVDTANTELRVAVTTYYLGTTAIVTGDYFKVGNEQLELGDKFTGFEYVLPVVNLLNCLRYYWRGTTDENRAHLYSANTTNMFVGSRSFPVSMRDIPVITEITAPTYTNCNFNNFVASVDSFTIRVDVTNTGIYRIVDGVYEADAEI